MKASEAVRQIAKKRSIGIPGKPCLQIPLDKIFVNEGRDTGLMTFEDLAAVLAALDE